MANTLTDGSLSIVLDISYDFEDQTNINVAASRSIGGKEASYYWNKKQQYNFPLAYVPSSDAALMNQWWTNSTQLYLFYDSTSYDCYLIGDYPPFMGLNMPYQNHWYGELLVRVI